MEAELRCIMTSKEKIDELMRTAGEVRGVTLYTDAEYIRRHEGEEALRHIEEETREMGYPIDYGEVRTMGWYPIGLRAVSLLAIRKVLDWSDEQLKEMGRAAPKYSIITKLMLRYLVSPEALMKSFETYWRKNYSEGSLSGKVADKSLILYLKDFEVPDPLYPYLEGYFASILGMVIGNYEKISVEHTKWLDGDREYHELVLRW